MRNSEDSFKLRFLALAILPFVLIVTAAGLSPALAAPPAPIQIGVLAPSTGPFAAYAKDIVDGAQLYVDEVHRNMAGHEVKLVVEDSVEIRPDVALTKTKKLVELDHVDALVGLVLSAAALAVTDYVTANKVPLIITGFACAEALTMEKASPYVFRATWSAAQVPATMAKWVRQNLKVRTAALIATDSVGTQEILMGFARAFEEAGGKVVQEIYTPLGTADMAPFISAIRRDVDVVVTQIVGADGARFVKQYEEFGLKGKIPLVDAAVAFTDVTLLPTEGESVVGTYNAQAYISTINNAKNRAFVEEFRAKYKRDPGAPAEATYVALAAIHQALKESKGIKEDGPKFLAALRNVKLDAPRGTFRFDRFQNVISDVHIGKIEHVGNQVLPRVVATVHDVDQFVGMSPEAYMKKPRLLSLKGTFGK